MRERVREGVREGVRERVREGVGSGSLKHGRKVQSDCVY